MAASRVGKSLALLPILLFSSIFAQIQIDEVAPASSSNVPLSAVSDLLLQSALNSLKEQHTFRNGDLVNAQKITKPPHVIYRLTLKLEPICSNDKDNCRYESCTLDVRQHEQGVINVMQDSKKCTYLQAQSKPEEEIIENIEKQIINQSNSFDREVQTSSDKKDRPFVAVQATHSEYCPGCPYELNPSLPGLNAFGEQVLQSMDQAGLSDFKHKLISIVRVTRTVPPNTNTIQYKLWVEIGESNCLKTSLIEISECSLQSNLPIRLCLVTFEERPWYPGNRRITKNNCTDASNIDNEVIANIDSNAGLLESAISKKEEESTAKPEFFDQIAQEAQEVFRVPFTDEPLTDSDDLIVKELTQTKITLERDEGTEQPPKFSDDKIKEFDEFLKDFDIPIKTETTTVEDLGEPVTEVPMKKEKVVDKAAADKSTDESETTEEKAEIPTVIPTIEAIRTKRDVSTKLFENKAQLRKLAFKAVELIDEDDEDKKRKHLIDVLDTKREKRAHDIVYHLTIEVAQTDCSEKDRSTECLDEVIPGPTEICKLELIANERKPLQNPKLAHYTCKNKQESENRYKRQTKAVGAPQSHDHNDPKVQEFIQLGLQKYSETFEGDNEPMVSKVKDVTVQVVSGLLYKITTDIGVSTCQKGVKENCQLKADGGAKECVIEAWSQPWIDKGNPKITVKCDQNKRAKRAFTGQRYSEKMLEQSKQLKDEKLFQSFISKYNRNYATEEERERRFKIFRENLDLIEELQRNEQGTGRYGVTQFADLSKAEFKANYLGLRPELRHENDIPLPKAEIPDIELPLEYDWRHYNAVTPVKNQGSCGSCWAFSVTGNVEGQYAIKHGKLYSLSEQELVDCDKLDSGCNGGLPDQAYRAIEELGGLESESDYPYDGEDEKCHFNKDKVRVNVVSGLNITSNETQMAQWLVQNGPMSIGINANAMQFYFGGVSHPYKFLCSPDNLDHGVLIVGYGIKSYPIFKKKMPYWLIKNSWGPSWGEQGYYRVYRGDGTCGVNQMVTSAVIA